MKQTNQTKRNFDFRFKRHLHLTVMMLVIFLLRVNAGIFGQTVTLRQNKQPVYHVLKEIRKQTNYDLYASRDLIPTGHLVSVNLQNATLERALTETLKGLNLTFEIEGKTISIRRDSKPSRMEANSKLQLNVSGTVKDASGISLPGVSVKVKDSKLGTTTNENGMFIIDDVDEGAVLVFSSVGYMEMEVAVKGRTNLGVVVLKESHNELELVEISVNTGYQSLAKERSAGSFAKPDMSIVSKRSSSMNILQRLDGLVPGLTVNNSPDASSNPFLIRGLTTVGTADYAGNFNGVGVNRNPLYVVDGVAQDNVANINPQDVADITVLKDATAASIWGTRAANGVIVITTKRGSSDQRLAVTYDAFVNFRGKPDLDYLPTLRGRKYLTAMQEIFPEINKNSSWQNTYSSFAVPPHLDILYNVADLGEQNRKLDSLGAIDNRDEIRDHFYRNALLTNHTLSFSGGGQMYSMYGSASYTGDRNNIPENKDNLYKINLRQDLNFNDRVKIYLVTDFSNQRQSSPFNVDIPTNFISYQRFTDSQGNPLDVNYLKWYSEVIRAEHEADSKIDLSYNPLKERDRGYTNSEWFTNRIVGGLNVKLLKNLRFEGTYGYNSVNRNGSTFLAENNYEVRHEAFEFTERGEPGEDPIYHLPISGGRMTESNRFSNSWTVRNQFIFDKDWQKHQLTALVGQEATSQKIRGQESTLRGWNDQLQSYAPIDYVTLANGIYNTINGYTASLVNPFVVGDLPIARTTSYYANVSYTYLRKYTFNTSWRIDESNLFGRDRSAQNRPVWSVGGKWLMGRESFLSENKSINSLDLRATYGISGNAPLPGTAASFDIMQSGNFERYVNGYGLTLTTPGNDKLTWERTQIYNVGLDFALFTYRLSGSIDAYLKKTDNLIGNLPVSAFTGFETIIGNFGDMENKGVELNLQTINMSTPSFTWTTGLTLGYNKNKITKLELPGGVISTGDGLVDRRYYQGYAAYSIFAYRYAGLNTSGDPQIRRADGTVTAEPNVSLAEDIVYKGSSQPIWSGGFSNVFQYKQFELAANMVYNLGHVMRRDVNTFWQLPNSFMGYSMTPHEEFADRWKEAGDENRTDIPRFAAGMAGDRQTNYYALADANVFNASYIKLRDLTLSYNLPQSLVQRLKADKVSFRAQLSNVMLWKANKHGIDPEFHDATSGRILRNGQNSVTLGVNLTF